MANKSTPTPVPATDSFGQELYTGAAELGRVTSTISIVIASIFCGGMILGGIYLILKKDDEPEERTQFSQPQFSQPQGPPVNDMSKEYRKIGFFLVVIGLIILVICWMWWYAVRKSKVLAAASGAGTAIDWIIPGGSRFGPGFNTGFGPGFNTG